MKALQVSINDELVGFFGTPKNDPFFAMLGNIPRRYMRGTIMTETTSEKWQWQLPDIHQGECIEFCIKETSQEQICSPNIVSPRED